MSDEPTEQPPVRPRPTFHRASLHAPNADPYDHEIRLLDLTSLNASAAPSKSTSPGTTPAATPAVEPGSASGETLERRRTRLRDTVKGEYNRQKWKRYQQDRSAQDVEESSRGIQGDDAGPAKDTYGTSTLRKNYDKVRDKIPIWQKKKEYARSHEEHEIDILYENQRGSFFCGIPLYSHKSLLNFDPSAWQTKDFKESAVNITNAQPPDPSWTWAWKTWYVDMSHDVDEEGWEYSLSFQQGFSWHGTHPWFHSFVRRRRWLRKRTKVNLKSLKHAANPMKEGHKLNLDYFTIHSGTRESSRDRTASFLGTQGRQSSLITSRSYQSENESEEISDLNALMKALKNDTVDRKKLNHVQQFLLSAGPEMHYLPDKIPEIMDMFVYQTSRRQVLDELQKAAAKPQADDDKRGGRDENQGDMKAAKATTQALQDRDEVDNVAETPIIKIMSHDQGDALERAIEIAHKWIQDYQYWSDIKATAAQGEVLDVPPPPPLDHEMAPQVGRARPPISVNTEVDRTPIRGIPQSAGVGQEVGIARRVNRELQSAQRTSAPVPEETGGGDKGKGRA